jgi:glycosyltransferase involved in cell wall biosynthesis
MPAQHRGDGVKILTLTCEYPPIGGGGATASQVLAEALVRAGHEVDVLTARMPSLLAEEVIGGVRVQRVPGWRRQRHYSTALEQASFLWPMLRQGLQLAAARRHDLVHAHFVVPTGIVARRLARRQGIPYVVTAHGSDVPGYNPDRFALLHQVIGRAWRAVLADAAAVTSPSAFVRELIRRRAKAAVEVIPNPYDAAGPASLPKRRRVLTVARLVQRKGVQHLIAALGGLEQDVECVIAGDGPLRPELEAMARRQGLAIEFTGFIGREALAELYASAAIFVLPSLQENFPMVLLEAMNAGCAVVTTDHPGCLEVVGKAGLTVPATDVCSLRNALSTLLTDPRRVTSLAKAARERAAIFASARVAEQFTALFEQCIRARAGSTQHAAVLGGRKWSSPRRIL